MTDELRRLQGVWFPTHQSLEGRPAQVLVPVFPAPQDVALLSVVNDTFHISVNAEYYWTGGRFRLSDDPKTMWFDYPSIPDEYNTSAHYQLLGDELLICSRPADRLRLSYTESATRYVRVAPEPTTEMLALFEFIMRDRAWTEWDWDSKSYRPL
jgi:hypothetical protein